MAGLRLLAPADWSRRQDRPAGVDLSLQGAGGTLNVSLIEGSGPIEAGRLEDELELLSGKGHEAEGSLVSFAGQPGLRIVVVMKGALIIKYVLSTELGEAVVTYGLQPKLQRAMLRALAASERGGAPPLRRYAPRTWGQRLRAFFS